jgi:hypothetical protein
MVGNITFEYLKFNGANHAI